MQFKNAIINLNRAIVDGKYVIKLAKYASRNGIIEFIEKDISHGETRIIRIKFSAKVMGGKHTIWIIAKHANKNKWVHKGYKSEIVSMPSCKEFEVHLEVPAKEDFNIQFEDRDVGHF